MDFQIFFFSTFFLILGGIFLSFEKFAHYLKIDKIFRAEFVQHKQISILVGLACVIFGIVMLLKPVDIKVIGDLFPVIHSLIGGVSILVSRSGIRYSGNSKFLIWAQEFIKTNVAIIGLLMVAFGIIHSLFPNLLFL